MSENIRIKTTPGGGESSVNLSINQKFDFIEILSLKISQAEAYRRFCSDYGVVVGRVIVNNGVGVPNAKVSIFIPTDEVDLEDPEISGLYPFETITDVDSEGIGYNLLPRNNRGKDDCFTPVGTFPSKREIQDNPLMGEIYCKYYKFTTTTNESGDFMFFGVPVGTHFMHVNADISDIGFLSQRPYDLIRDGANKKTFNSPTKFKGRRDSTNLTQLKTSSPLSVTVPPFWGDTEECNIGIARSDVNLTTYIVPHAIFMGSIVSDNDKHALSRTCVPRKKLGKMDEMVTGEGRIEMIRKTFKGGTERFDVEGGQVIDGDGAWAYQIPMNLEYMVTAEDGTFVPSGDPKRGIPTKAKVRFRVGMNTNGDEGKNRTRAKYLVPHNPSKWSETDFTFDERTSDKVFSELSWNKIYTVKNYIRRVQARGGSENRNFIGFKNVDDSANRNPIPFNKLDNDINPLFTLLCVLFRIIARLVGVFNGTTIPFINTIILLIYPILLLICNIIKGIGILICGLPDWISGKACDKKFCIGSNKDDMNPDGAKLKIGKCKCKDLDVFVPYILLKCTQQDGGESVHAPNGKSKGIIGGGLLDPFTRGFRATEKVVDEDYPGATFHYADDGHNTPQHYMPSVGAIASEIGQTIKIGNKYLFEDSCNIAQKLTPEGCDAGWSKCQTLRLADSLDVFKFDFYNDWINGTLYPFLFKYKIKKRGRGRERFCEVDCDEFVGGVDNDEKNGPDNPCKRNYMVETCIDAIPQGEGGISLEWPKWLQNLNSYFRTNLRLYDPGVDADDRIRTRSGYIKKFEEELYYAPITVVGENKLFATDIVNLGSVFDCDWEGKPKFYQYLLDTTFNIPPIVGEYVLDTNDNPTSTIDVSGFDSGTNPGLIGDISCAGFNTNTNSCNNLKRLCELGVGLDERRTDSTVTPEVVYPVDNKITNQDVEAPFVRGIFVSLNMPNQPITEVYIDSGGFVNNTYPEKTTPLPTTGYQDPVYKKFRDYTEFSGRQNQKIWIYNNSFYFYFGLNKGKTALTKMKTKYFTECTPESDVDFFVVATDIIADTEAPTADGSIKIEVSGGFGPYTYQWSGPNNFTSTSKDISNLFTGTYTVVVTDSAGNQAEGLYFVGGPEPVRCLVQTTDATVNGGTGEINVTITNYNDPGTVPPYTVELYSSDSSGSLITLLESVPNVPNNGITFNSSNITKGYYAVKVMDDTKPTPTECVDFGYVSEPDALVVTLTGTDITCPGENNGTIKSNVVGGILPYTYQWSGPNNFTNTSKDINNLQVGSYTLTVQDSAPSPNSVSESVVINEKPPITSSTPTVVNGNCNSSVASISVGNVQGGTPPYTITVSNGITTITKPYSLNPTVITDTNNPTGLSEGIDSDKYIVTIEDSVGCEKNYFDIEVFNPDQTLSVDIFDNFVAYSSDNTIQPRVSVNIVGGTFRQNSNTTNYNTVYSYKLTLQSSSDGGATWSNVESNVTITSQGGSVYTKDVTPSGTATIYRVIVKDRNGVPGSCSVTATGNNTLT